ncbi:MAG: DegT/DnrJ/EryC1/StrS family aminotransferase [Calditrichaeota bacterium]|nr:MAG: DegT/DnrJ/EryC1/StrS family aminotransferase [Calditrichota bacterium]
MQVPFLDLKAQYLSIKDEIDSAIQNVIDQTAFVSGKFAKKFEEDFSKAQDVKFTIAVGNGTDAISIALFALGVKQGDEVITVANSFIATTEAISLLGGKPVLVDCEADSYNIDTAQIEAKITEKTKVIIPVHLYGQPANMEEITRIAKKYNLSVMEDSAQGVVAEYKGKKVGNFGDFATFSFYPGKNLGAYGDAGAIVTNNEKLAIKARMYANHGRIAKYDHEFEGVNSRLDGIQGAVLSVKLKYIAEWTERRRTVAKRYNELLADCEHIVLPKEMEYARHVYHLFVIRSKKRDELQSFLNENGIQSGIHYPIALHNLNAYKYLGHKPEDFPNANKFTGEILSLPIFPEMTEEQIQFVAQTIKNFK